MHLMHDNYPDNSKFLENMAIRQMKFNRLLKRIVMGMSALIAVMLIAGFLFFDSSSLEEKVSLQTVEPPKEDAVTASEALITPKKTENNDADVDLSLKKYMLDLFDFSENPTFKDEGNSIEYIIVHDEDGFRGSLGYDPSNYNGSPYRIVASGIPGKTLTDTAVSCNSNFKMDDFELPIDDTDSEDKEMTYRVLLPEDMETEEAMREEVETVLYEINEIFKSGGTLESFFDRGKDYSRGKERMQAALRSNESEAEKQQDSRRNNKERKIPAEPKESNSGENSEDNERPSWQMDVYDGMSAPDVDRIIATIKEVDYIPPDTNPPESRPPNTEQG